MMKIYQYRKHIQWGQYFIAALFSISVITLAFWDIQLFLQLTTQDNWPSSFRITTLVIITGGIILFTAEGFFAWYLYYRMAGVRVMIEDNTIVYKHRHGETKIAFAEITKIGLPSIPYLGGWITVVAGKKKIRLTVVVNEIGDFVQTLKASLDKIGFTNRYDEDKLFRFLKTAVFSDQSWDRIYSSLFWKLLLATLGIGLLGVGIAKISGNGGLFWVLLSFSFPTLVYIFTEIVYSIQIARSSLRESFFVPPRNIAYENSVYKIATGIGLIVYLMMALIMMFALK